MRKTPVLIIGAGPTGMTAALALAQAGVRSVLIEKRRQPGRHPRAHEISGRTLEILEGLGAPFRELSREASSHNCASRILFCRTVAEEAGRIDLNDAQTQRKYQDQAAAGAPYLNLSQTELEAVLRRRVQANQRIVWLPGREWQRLEQDDSGVRTWIRSNRAEEEIHSDYVLSCDGAGGAVRQSLGIAMDGPDRLQDFVNAYFTNDLSEILPAPAKLWFILRPDAAGVLIAHHSQRRWVYHVATAPGERIEDYDAARFTGLLRKALDRPDFVPHIESISSWRMAAQVATHFRAGRVFLLGDSAHRFPPTGGMGLNSGVADAHNLAWKLAWTIKGVAESELLESYDRERKPVVRRSCAASRKNYQDLFEIPACFGLKPERLAQAMRIVYAPILRPLRDWLLGRLLPQLLNLADKRLRRRMRLPNVRTRAQAAIARQRGHFDRIGLDLGFQYVDGAHLQSNANIPCDPEIYTPHFLPGARLPNAKLARGARRISIHRMLDSFKLTLFHAGDGARYRSALRACDLGAHVRLQNITGTLFANGVRTQWTDWTGLDASGALLVRPDGVVAARFQKDADAADALAALQERMCIRPRGAGPRRRVA